MCTNRMSASQSLNSMQRDGVFLASVESDLLSISLLPVDEKDGFDSEDDESKGNFRTTTRCANLALFLLTMAFISNQWSTLFIKL
jgi:hypothetical protein